MFTQTYLDKLPTVLPPDAEELAIYGHEGIDLKLESTLIVKRHEIDAPLYSARLIRVEIYRDRAYVYKLPEAPYYDISKEGYKLYRKQNGKFVWRFFYEHRFKSANQAYSSRYHTNSVVYTNRHTSNRASVFDMGNLFFTSVRGDAVDGIPLDMLPTVIQEKLAVLSITQPPSFGTRRVDGHPHGVGKLDEVFAATTRPLMFTKTPQLIKDVGCRVSENLFLLTCEHAVGLSEFRG